MEMSWFSWFYRNKPQNISNCDFLNISTVMFVGFPGFPDELVRYTYDKPNQGCQRSSASSSRDQGVEYRGVGSSDWDCGNSSGI